MLFQHITLALAAGVSLATAKAIDRRYNTGLCEIPEWTGIHFIGALDTGAGMVCESHWPEPDYFKKITTYSDGKTMRGLKIEYMSGLIQKYGNDFMSNEKSITFTPGELVTECQMSGNGIGSRLGRIHFKTSKGQDVVLGGNKDAQWWDIDVGSGLMTGLNIRSGLDIDQMSILFLAGRVERIEFSDFRFDVDPVLDGPELTPETLDTVYYWNGNTKDAKASFGGEETRSITTMITSGTTQTWGAEWSYSVKAEIPEIMEVSTTFGVSWGLQQTESTSISTTDTHSLPWNQETAIGPNSGLKCSAVAFKGDGDFPYTGTTTFYLDNGNTYRYDERGVVRSIKYSVVHASCEPITEQPPSGSKVGQVSLVEGSVANQATPPTSSDAPTGTPNDGGFSGLMHALGDHFKAAASSSSADAPANTQA